MVAAGCGHAAMRPTAMAQADTLRQTPASIEAARLAPQAYANAEKIRREAERAYESGDPAGAQILSEHAIAAYEHALVLGRLARAADSVRRTSASLASAERSLSEVEEELARATASFSDIEARIKVVRDALPLTPVGRADAGRDQARLAASRSLGLDARLMCAAAKMLAPQTPGIDQAQAAVDELDRRIAAHPFPAPIDLAMRARAGCLSVLVRARRPGGATSSIGKADALLSDLSSEGARVPGIDPLRDERGVVVTLRGVSDPTGRAHEPIATLARLAQAHPEFPVQVVVHGQSSRADEIARQRALGAAIAKTMQDGGVAPGRLEVQAAGAAHPVIAPRTPAAAERNSRVEIVFVDPGG
jgi:hypothetical protein